MHYRTICNRVVELLLNPFIYWVLENITSMFGSVNTLMPAELVQIQG